MSRGQNFAPILGAKWQLLIYCEHINYFLGDNGEKIANQQSEELSILIMGSKGSVRINILQILNMNSVLYLFISNNVRTVCKIRQNINLQQRAYIFINLKAAFVFSTYLYARKIKSF